MSAQAVRPLLRRNNSLDLLKKLVAFLWTFHWACLAFYTPPNASLAGLLLCFAAYTGLWIRRQHLDLFLSYPRVIFCALRAFTHWPLVAAWLAFCLIALYPDLFSKKSSSIIRYWLLAPPAGYIAFRLLGWDALRKIILGVVLGLIAAGSLYIFQNIFPDLAFKQIRNVFTDRFSLFFQHPTDFAALLSWVVIVLLYCRLNGKIVWHRKGDWLLLLPLLALIFFSYSRGPQLALLVLVVVMLLIKFRPRPKIILLGLLLTAAGFAALNRMPLTDDYRINRFIVLAQDPLSGSVASRMPIWEAAVDGIKQKPFFGHGVHGFYAQHQKYITQNSSVLKQKYQVVETDVGTVHNLPLALAHDSGLVGLSLFILLSACLLRRARKLGAPAGLAGLGVIFCWLTGITETGVHEPWFIFIFFACGALAVTDVSAFSESEK